MLRLSRYTLVAALTLVLAACSSTEPDDPTPTPTPTVTPPTFSIASTQETCNSGPCLQFFATPSVSVTLTEVVITNPVGTIERFNAQNVVVLQGQTSGLQDPTVGYSRVSGNWTFRFVGSRSPAVDNGNFDVTTTLSVGAFAPGVPAN